MKYLLALLLLVLSTSADAATATGLSAAHRGGQTFLTFVGIGLDGDGTTYSVLRSSSPITSAAGLVPIATLAQDSGRLRYDDNPSITYETGQNLKTGFVITDGGPHLPAGTGLLVWTTTVSGSFCYAVTNSTDVTVTPGTNALSTCVSETYQATPGAVLVSVDTNYGGNGRTVRHYYAWEPYENWRSEWGYYGFAFVVQIPSTGSAPWPMYARFHAAPGPPYAEASASSNWGPDFINLSWIDNFAVNDPYGGASGWTRHTGRLDSVTGLFRTFTADRIARYITLVRDNATGDGYDFHVDANRIYSTGGSGGSYNALFAFHHQDLIVASETQIGFSENASYNAEPNETSVRVNAVGGSTVKQYFDYVTMASSGPMPPIIHDKASNDTLDPSHYPPSLLAFETYHQPYAIEWRTCGHCQYSMSDTFPQWTPTRFLRNEARPAFGHASTSDTPESVAPWNSASTDPPGQRNATLDWQSARHPIANGEPIADATDGAAISLTSSVAATADVTVGNLQAFHPAANVPWTASGGQSGTATRNADGSLTVAALSIAAAPAATRLALGAAQGGGGGGSTAAFVGVDAVTKGDWKGVYGASGSVLANDATTLPAGASVGVAGGAPFTWASSTGDARGLSKTAPPGRIAATWFNGAAFTVAVTPVGGVYRLSLYVVDWDNVGRAETIAVLDGATVLDTRSVAGFVGGQYLSWSVSGPVTVRITRSGGPNAVLSAVFLDGDSGPPPPPPPDWTPLAVTPFHRSGSDQLKLCADDGRCWGPVPRLP